MLKSMSAMRSDATAGRRVWGRLSLLLIGLVAVCILSPQKASAVGSWAPDAGDFQAGNDIFLVVSQQKSSNTSTGGANGLDAPSSRVTIYSLTNNPEVTIRHPNQCKGGDPDTTNNPYDSLGLNYTTEFSFSWNGGSREPNGSKDPDGNNWGRNYIAQRGVGECTDANNDWVTTLNLPESSAQTIDGQKYYIAQLTASIRTDVSHGSVNAFKVHTSSGLVSFNSTSGKKFALQDRRDDVGNEYSTFNLLFALPCGADTQSKTFEWFDADQGSSNQPAQISYELWRQPRAGGAWEKQSGPFTDLGGNDVGGSRTHQILKDYIYSWRWINVAKSNGIQFEIPFNSINATLECKDKAEITPSVSLNPAGTVTPGETVTAGAKFKNTTTSTARVTYTRQFWKSDGKNGFSIAEGDVAVHAPFTDTVNVPPSDLALPDWQYTVMDTSYNYICTAMVNITAVDTAGVNTVVHAGTPGPLCIPVGKYPSLQVTGGDLRTGGGFAPDCSATASGSGAGLNRYAPFSVRGHDYGNTNHSRDQFGIFTPGIVNYLSSAQTSNGKSELLTFGNTNWLSNADQGVFYGPFALSQKKTTHCLTDVFSPDRYPTPLPATKIGGGLTAPLAAGTSYTFDFNSSADNKTLVLPGLTLGASSGQRTYIRVKNSGNAIGNTVEIAGNIEYQGKLYGDIRDLPQFVLLVEDSVDVKVRNNVTRLDGIYALQGRTSAFHTCAAFDPTVLPQLLGTGSACDQPLKINGAIIAGGKLYTYRTYGHASSGETYPAEIFNLRPDTLLSDYARYSSGPVRIKTTFQTELSPRY